jgi:hypothetical protein
VNREKVGEALYDLFERVGIEFDRDQAKPLAAGLGQIITACIAAAHEESPTRCSVCACLLPVPPCGHACCATPATPGGLS